MTAKQPLARLCLALLACFLAACGKKQETHKPAEEQPSVSSEQVEERGSPQVQAPTRQAPASKPDNIAQLNQNLLSALTFGQPEQALAAIEQGATSSTKDRYGLPVIFIAAQQGHPEVVAALLDAGADPNASIGTTFNDDGVGYAGTSDGTPLGYAAAKGQLETMALLAQAGAEVNHAGPEGTTPLMQAVEAGQLQAVEWLLQAGADPTQPNQTGGTALSLAQMFFNPDPERQKIIDLLQAHSR